MVLEKKKIKKTKQKGGFPLDTIFRTKQKKTYENIIRNAANRILWEPERLKFIKGIKELLLSPEYQKNVPVFYGNQFTKNNEKYNGYNEYICKTILGRFGGISSRRRVFIINPFAALVYRIYILCIFNNYKSKINELKNLLRKLLKLNTFIGFPKIEYLPYGIRFCIVKDNDGIEKVITSQNKNYSSCNSVSGCSLIMLAEIRKENLPLDVDISELYNILKDDFQLSNYYNSSINKTEYDNRITLKNKLSKNYYFKNIYNLLLQLNKLQDILTKSNKPNNSKILEIKTSISILYRNIILINEKFNEKFNKKFNEKFNERIDYYLLIQDIILEILDFVIQELGEKS